MKLRDKDLHYALWCAERHTGNSMYEEAMADLDDGILDIEGYERVEWVKFDWNDKSTLPEDFPCLVAFDGGIEICIGFRGDFIDIFGEAFDKRITHWRALPKHPQKQGVQNETE